MPQERHARRFVAPPSSPPLPPPAQRARARPTILSGRANPTFLPPLPPFPVASIGHPEDRTQPAFPVYHRKLANPAPLGLSAFALTTCKPSSLSVCLQSQAQGTRGTALGPGDAERRARPGWPSVASAARPPPPHELTSLPDRSTQSSSPSSTSRRMA